MGRINQSELELKFEAYLKNKASSELGKKWLNDFKKGGLTTLILIMHFIYDKQWMNMTFDEREEDLIFSILSKVKKRVFEELFSTNLVK
jgi:hypothetical protein